MATTFKYQAKDATGNTVSGTIQAASQNEAVADLRRRRLTPIQVERSGGLSLFGRRPGTRRTATRSSVRKGELELFTRQLSTMLSAGIPMLEALDILASQAESAGFRFCLTRIVDDIRTGADLSRALEAHPRVFTDIYVSMIRAGEVSGQLDVILVRLSEYLEAAARLRAEIKAAMTYPVISLVLVTAIAGFLMIGIVPSFKPVFESLEVELPGLTVAIMDLAFWMRANWWLLALAVPAIIAAVKMWKKSPKGAYAWDVMVLKLPVFGPLFRKVALSRFARTFATLIKSGVPILAAMEIVSETAGNLVLSRVIDKAKDNVSAGEALSEPLATSDVFPPMVTKMIGIGERSGALDALLEKISEFYDQQVEADVKSLTSMIEPIMIALMGVIVGGIVLAVFLPIFKLQEKLAGG